MNTVTLTLLLVVGLAAVIVWFDKRCLDDLAHTDDSELRHFSRSAWAALIIATFPFGPCLYLLTGKGPRRPI